MLYCGLKALGSARTHGDGHLDLGVQKVSSIGFSFALWILPAIAFVQTPTESKIWGAEEVDRYIQDNPPKRAAALADPFSVPPPPPAPATDILLRSKINRSGSSTSDGAGYNFGATWQYNAVSETMEIKGFRPSGVLVRLDTQGVDLTGGAPYRVPDMQGIAIFESYVRQDAGVGQNAFGAKVNMELVTVVRRGMGEIVTSTADRVGPPLPPGEYAYVHSWRIVPDAARSLSEHLEWQVVAKSVAWAPSKWVICGSQYIEATMSRPTTIASSGCYLSVRFETFRIVDTRDGSVIKEWTK